MTARVVLAIAKIAPGAASYRTIGKPLLVQLGNTCLSVQQSRAAYVLRSFHSNCAACSAGTSTYCNELEQVLSRVKSGHKKNNIPSSIVDKIGRNLHLAKNHPLGIIKTK